MTKLTVKELSTKTNVSEGTIRSWIMKPIDGVPYSSEKVNYGNLVEKLNKYYESFKETFGFEAKDIEIVKAERSTKKWLTIEQVEALKPYTKVTIHNYSLKTELQFIQTHEVKDKDGKETMNKTFIFCNNSCDDYKMYTLNQLQKQNIKIELAE